MWRISFFLRKSSAICALCDDALSPLKQSLGQKKSYMISHDLIAIWLCSYSTLIEDVYRCSGVQHNVVRYKDATTTKLVILKVCFWEIIVFVKLSLVEDSLKIGFRWKSRFIREKEMIPTLQYPKCTWVLPSERCARFSMCVPRISIRLKSFNFMGNCWFSLHLMDDTRAHRPQLVGDFLAIEDWEQIA